MFWLGFVLGVLTGEFCLLLILILCMIGKEKEDETSRYNTKSDVKNR